MTLRRFVQSFSLLLFVALFFSACQPARNFTTYFNLFYNMERIMDEVEEELLYIREQKSPEPTIHIPYDDALLRGSRMYNHLERRSMNVEETRANKVKLDSILLKGSKLLARSARSDYVDDAVYFIGKTFFYEREWYQAQQKSEELIANFPDSKWSPDAHLVLAMTMLHQGNPTGALTMLSRTVDVAWAHQRLDVLIDAFRLNADVHLADGNVEEALLPFRRAITLSTDSEDKARWQYELGVVRFRSGQFQEALAEFERVRSYSPDVLTRFQSGLQRAVTHRVLGNHQQAERELEELRGNGNFAPWYGLVELEKVNLAAARSNSGGIADSVLAQIDSSYPGKSFAAYGVYERGVQAMRAGDYPTAQANFQKVLSSPVPFQRKAQRYSQLLSQYFTQHEKVTGLKQYPITPYPDTIRAGIADSYYNLARLFNTLDVRDSIQHYYLLSSEWAPSGSVEAARAIYALSVNARNAGRTSEADSLMEELVQHHGLTDYGAEARRMLGYTDYAKADTAEDLYLSGLSFSRTGDDVRALTQFQKVVDGYPGSPYAPQAYYAIGLLYERRLENRDSAFNTYVRLIGRYPASPQAATVRPIVDAVLSSRSNKPRSDADPVPRNDGGVQLDQFDPGGHGAFPMRTPADQARLDQMLNPPAEARDTTGAGTGAVSPPATNSAIKSGTDRTKSSSDTTARRPARRGGRR